MCCQREKGVALFWLESALICFLGSVSSLISPRHGQRMPLRSCSLVWINDLSSRLLFLATWITVLTQMLRDLLVQPQPRYLQPHCARRNQKWLPLFLTHVVHKRGCTSDTKSQVKSNFYLYSTFSNGKAAPKCLTMKVLWREETSL